jgi:hypothetical protein
VVGRLQAGFAAQTPRTAISLSGIGWTFQKSSFAKSAAARGQSASRPAQDTELGRRHPYFANLV